MALAQDSVMSRRMVGGAVFLSLLTWLGAVSPANAQRERPGVVRSVGRALFGGLRGGVQFKNGVLTGRSQSLLGQLVFGKIRLEKAGNKTQVTRGRGLMNGFGLLRRMGGQLATLEVAEAAEGGANHVLRFSDRSTVNWSTQSGGAASISDDTTKRLAALAPKKRSVQAQMNHFLDKTTRRALFPAKAGKLLDPERQQRRWWRGEDVAFGTGVGAGAAVGLNAFTD